jgi:hypothetical protein
VRFADRMSTRASNRLIADVYANMEPGRLRVALARAEVGQF